MHNEITAILRARNECLLHLQELERAIPKTQREHDKHKLDLAAAKRDLRDETRKLIWLTAQDYDRTEGIIRLRGRRVVKTFSNPTKGYVALRSTGLSADDIIPHSLFDKCCVAWPLPVQRREHAA